MREENQLKIICRILENYHLDQPLGRYLKDFYKKHPQMGARDRRLASGFVYNYFRIGRSLTDVRLIEKLTIANFLCSTTSHPLLAYCLDKFTLLGENSMESSIAEKIKQIQKLYSTFIPEKIFPFMKHLSDQIDRENFLASFIRQPKLWIRIRRGFQDAVGREFIEKNIAYEKDFENPLTCSLANSISLENTDAYRKGYFEIQDWSSQQTIRFIEPTAGDTWWDACCGSGGKSLMMADAEPQINIVATDNRASILKNLEERFSKVGILNFKAIQTDLTDNVSLSDFFKKHIDKHTEVLADVPCSGSGTWGRTPEWLIRFDEDSLVHFVSKQRKLIQGLSLTMCSGGKLVYITCSVFKEENEENVEWITSGTGLNFKESAYIKGFSIEADTMFAAVFTKE